MTLSEIISLTKAGYKKKDIDDMIAQEKAAPADPDPQPEPQPDPDPAPDPQPDPEPEPASQPDDQNDLSKLLDAEKKKNEELTAKLKKAQAANVKKNIDPGKDEKAERIKRMEERARSFM